MTEGQRLAQEDLRNPMVWVENLSNHEAVFRHPAGDVYRWAAHGFLGSVIEVPDRVRNNSFFARNIRRGNVRELSAEDALKRIDELVERDEVNNSDYDRIMKPLQEGASEHVGQRYTREDLSDTGRETGEIAAEDVWSRKKGGQPGETVRRSNAPAIEQPVEGKLPPEKVLTPRVKEGEWSSDTGE